MANEEHLARLKQGTDAWDRWRAANPKVRPDLSGAILTGANFSRDNLEEVDFSGANLDGANLSEANLSRTNLSRATLIMADLSRATLIGANLNGANLSEANLSKTDLSGAEIEADLSGAILSRVFLHRAILCNADLTEANLTGAMLADTDLTRARIGWTNFGAVDLSNVHGLKTIRHYGPSVIGIDTLYRSQGNIPEVFLREAGVPEDFITYIKALVGRLFEFYSCFISYSSKDQEFAERLFSDLQNNRVRCWFAPHDVQGGRKLHEQIDQAIRVHERLLLILSPHSMASEWVKTEIAKARQREVREKRQVLFPMRLVSFEAVRDWQCFDADTGKDSAREIREFFIPDFSNWKNYNACQVAFQRLLRDLKADT